VLRLDIGESFPLGSLPQPTNRTARYVDLRPNQTQLVKVTRDGSRTDEGATSLPRPPLGRVWPDGWRA